VTTGPVGSCVDPPQHSYLAPYCFGEATQQQRDEFEAHLLRCDTCWSELQRLEATIRVIRTAPALLRPDPRQLALTIGLAGRLQAPFRGHRRFVFVASAIFGLPFVASIWTELGYSFDRFGGLAFVLSPVVWLAAAASMLIALWVQSRSFTSGRNGLVRSALTLIGAVSLLLVVLAFILPVEQTVRATFTTRTAFGAYFRNVIVYFLPAGLAYILWPFNIIIGLQREIAKGRWANTLDLLSGIPTALRPPGTWFVKPWVLAIPFVPATLLTIGGTNFLLDNLMPGPYATLFAVAYYARVILWFVMAIVGLFWYVRCLDILKAESKTLQELA
jgi:anti-sigma factor RsiW